MIEVVMHGGGRRRGVMPLVEALTLGAEPECDWPVDDALCGGRSVTLVPLGEHVRVDPRGRTLRLHGRRPIRSPRLLRVPFRFTLGRAEFEVRSADGGADAPMRSDDAFDRIVDEAPAAPGAPPVPAWIDRWRAASARHLGGHPWMLGGVAVLVTVGIVGVGLSASVFSSRADAGTVPAAEARRLPAMRTGAGSLMDGYAVSPRVDTRDRARRRLESLLRSAEAEPGVTIGADANGPVVSGEASAGEIPRLTRILERAMREDPDLAGLRIDLTPLAEVPVLPFRVEQVVGGASPYLVLGDGTLLEPGQRHEGVALVAIQGHRLVFQGARRIEVDW